MKIRLFNTIAKLFTTSYVLILIPIKEGYAQTTPCTEQLKQSLKTSAKHVTISNKCPLAHTFVTWLWAQKLGSFEDIKKFMTQHPKWPRQSTLRRQAEKDLSERGQENKTRYQEIVTWFNAFPPLSVQGLKVYAQTAGPSDYPKVQNAFLTISAGGSEFKNLVSAMPAIFTKKVVFKKVSHYLNNGDVTSAKELMRFLSETDRKITSTRLLLQNHGSSVKITEDVSSTKDLGLKLDYIRAYRKTERNDEAKAILTKIQPQSNYTEKHDSYIQHLWTERNIIARRYLEQKDPKKAYDILLNHGLISGEHFANAEFLLGWISLRFLKNPKQALQHFESLYGKVKTPISVARACFWLGECFESLGNKQKAKEWWNRAKAHPSTYYGQLAYQAITGKIPQFTPTSLRVDSQIQQRFQKRELFQVIKLLVDLGEMNYIETFALSLSEDIQDYKEISLLVEFLHNRVNKNVALEVYKKSMKSYTPLIPAAYPHLNYIPQKTVQPAFAHAIIRQESRFKQDAVSTAGALGLMQLMPATAAQIIKKHKLPQRKLTDPQHNVKLGCIHLKSLMDRYNGSMILASAAYNAGATAVDNWISQFGDPRAHHVNTVDWVESIPYMETRNYVQRVMENYNCYK